MPSMANNAMTWSFVFGFVTHAPLQTRLPLSVTSARTKLADPLRIAMPVTRQRYSGTESYALASIRTSLVNQSS